jgi:hypothetical protein
MEIKGTAVASIMDYVKSNFPENFNDWLSELPDDSKKIFTDLIDPTKWYPIQEAAIAPTRIIGDLFFDGDYIKASRESGKHSAQKALTGIYKIFVKGSSTSYIVERASRIFSTFYRPCEMTIKSKIKNTVVLQISNMNINDEVVEYRIIGWIQRAMEISGARNVICKILLSVARGDATTEIEIRWD